VFMLQGLIVLFAGAMAQVAAPALFRLYRAAGGGRAERRAPATPTEGQDHRG
jgi:hypothetical protein